MLRLTLAKSQKAVENKRRIEVEGGVTALLPADQTPHPVPRGERRA